MQKSQVTTTRKASARSKLIWLVLLAAFAVGATACAMSGDLEGPDDAIGQEEQAISVQEHAISVEDQSISEDDTENLDPTIPPPSCSGYSTCYCLCRWFNRCDQNPAECDDLADCLDDCDAEHPGCPTPGGGFPSSPGECF